MRKILLYTLIIFIYNLFLLTLPVMFFLAFTQWTMPDSLHFLPWLYCIFLLVSPILTIVLEYRMINGKMNLFNSLLPIITTFLGFLPFWVLYSFINSIWMPSDYLLFLGLPILFGVFVDVLAVLFRSKKMNPYG